MLYCVLITLLIVAISVLLLGVKVFFVKGGRFPNSHVSGNKAMRKRGLIFMLVNISPKETYWFFGARFAN